MNNFFTKILSNFLGSLQFLRVLSFFCALAYNKTNDNELEEFS